MDQSVQTYASASARTSALATPVEGQVTYLEDTNLLYVYNGSAWVSVGDIADGSITNAKLANSSVTINGTSVALGASATLNPPGNAIINGAFDIWQRGTTGAGYVNAAAPGFVADRWQGARGGAVAGQTMSRVSLGSTYQQQYAMRLQRDSGNTSTQDVRLSQSIETANSIRFAGQTVTLSFYARKGANYSAASNAFNAILYSGTGTDQNLLISGFTGVATVSSVAATLTDTFQRFTATGTVSGSATQLGLVFSYTPVGTAGAADYVEIVDVQLEAGSVATPFKRNAPSIQAELAACQRYYEKSYDIANPPGTSSTNGLAELFGSSDSSGNLAITISFKVTKRATPTITLYITGGTPNVWAYSRNGASGNSGATADRVSNTGFRGYLATGAAWVVANGGGHWVAENEL
jgi:hypothetical protein